MDYSPQKIAKKKIIYFKIHMDNQQSFEKDTNRSYFLFSSLSSIKITSWKQQPPQQQE